MEVDAIGAALGASSATNLQSTALGQEDFLRLFLTELNFQDPLEPLDNREFLAQIAQFAGLEQSRQTSESIDNLVFLNASAQSVSLLGQQVGVNSPTGPISGTVSAVRFSENGSLLTIEQANGDFLSDVRLSQVSLIRPTQP